MSVHSMEVSIQNAPRLYLYQWLISGVATEAPLDKLQLVISSERYAWNVALIHNFFYTA